MRGVPRERCGDFARALIVDFHFENLRGALANNFQILGRIKVQMKDDAKTIAQRRGQQTRAA